MEQMLHFSELDLDDDNEVDTMLLALQTYIVPIALLQETENREMLGIIKMSSFLHLGLAVICSIIEGISFPVSIHLYIIIVIQVSAYDCRYKWQLFVYQACLDPSTADRNALPIIISYAVITVIAAVTIFVRVHAVFW